MEIFTLFGANLTILMVLSASFLVLARKFPDQTWWRAWSLANFALALSLCFFALEPHLPKMTVFVVPNLLLLLGFGLHLQAARRFAGIDVHASWLWLPVAVLTAVNVPALVIDNYSLVYIATNLLVLVLAAKTALAYAGKGLGGLVSRYGMVLGFVLMAAEGAVRAAHGVALGDAMGAGLTNDIVLTTHLVVSLVFVTLSGAFALGITFERTAREQRDIASRDPLTGLYNRREFDRRLDAMLQARSGAAFAVLQLDLDFFKQINDRYGHVSGDEALVAVADLIRNSVREGDCFARLGGEEFGLLLPDVDRNCALGIAERIRRLVETMTFDFASDGFRLTVSAGLYHGTGGDLDSRGMMQAVDRSLYRSKNNGRNQVSLAEAA